MIIERDDACSGTQNVMLAGHYILADIAASCHENNNTVSAK